MVFRQLEADEFVERVREAGLQPRERLTAEPLCRYLDGVIETRNWQMLDDICQKLYALGGLAESNQHFILSSVLDHDRRQSVKTVSLRD